MALTLTLPLAGGADIPVGERGGARATRGLACGERGGAVHTTTCATLQREGGWITGSLLASIEAQPSLAVSHLGA